VVIGAGFSSVVNATVKDLITPLIAAVFKASDFSNLAFIIFSEFMIYELSSVYFSLEIKHVSL
jgi:large-conductance mechanosensitive channel